MDSRSPSADAGAQHAEPATEAWLGLQRLGVGTLRIGEAQLTWTDDESGAGQQQVALAYPAIHVHAIGRGGDAFTRPHLLLMAECGGGDPPAVEELRFCPAAVDSLPAMFEAMSRCQAANSDAGEGGGGGGFRFGDVPDNNDNGDIDGERFHGGDGEGDGDDDDVPDFDHLLVAGPEEGVGVAVGVAWAGDSDIQPMDTDQFEDAP